MEFFEGQYLELLRERDPELFMALRKRGQLDEFVRQKGLEAEAMLDQLLRAQGIDPKRDINGRRMAEEQVRAVMFDFPVPKKEQNPEPSDDPETTSGSGSPYETEVDPRTGLNHEIEAAFALAACHIDAGARAFNAFCNAMVDDLGEAIRPYLRAFYESLRHWPGFDATGMTAANDIERLVEAPPWISEPEVSLDQQLPVNEWPVNKAAKRWLAQSGLEINSNTPYIVQLAWWGFDQGVPLSGRGSEYLSELELAMGSLLNPHLDPAKLTRWFLTNPDGPVPQKQSDTLELALQQAATWEEAAQVAMETFYDRIAAENDHYR